MEERKIQKIFDALKSETLTERERFVMRKELELLMSKHPLKVPTYIRVFERFNAFDTAALHYVGSHSIALATLVLVLATGVGTSYAAGGALPGDVLYPIKIHINEQVQGVLAVSDVAKVEWSTEQTQRRLEEAEVLAAKGELNEKNSTEIAAQLTNSRDDFDKRVAVLAQMHDGDETVSDVQSDFDASLVAHERVLASLGDNLPKVKNAITPILASVRARTRVSDAKTMVAMPTMMMATEIATNTVAQKDSSKNKGVATRKKQRAEQKLREVRDLASGAQGTIGSSTYTYFHSEARSTQQEIFAGDKNIDDGNFDQAIESYQRAIQVSTEAKAGINAEIHLRQHVQLPNFNFISSDTSDDEGEKENMKTGRRGEN